MGDGPVAEEGLCVKIRYVGYLNRGDVLYPRFKLSFILGERDTTAMLMTRLQGMRVGGIRETVLTSPFETEQTFLACRQMQSYVGESNSLV